MIRIFKIISFILFLSLSFDVANSETLNFPVGIWEGDVKKGKAHGKGVLTFNNGAIYEGKIKKNKIHGVGKLTTPDGEVYDGKWKFGKFYQKINKKTRKEIILQTKGRFFWVRTQIRGKDNVYGQWFAAEEKAGSYVLTPAGKKKMEEAIAKKQADSSSGSSGGSASSGC